MKKYRVVAKFEQELNNDFWGIEAIAEDGLLTEDYIKELIYEDLSGFIEDCYLTIKIKEKGGLNE